jgi:hypothetical protein
MKYFIQCMKPLLLKKTGSCKKFWTLQQKNLTRDYALALEEWWESNYTKYASVTPHTDRFVSFQIAGHGFFSGLSFVKTQRHVMFLVEQVKRHLI